MKITNVIAARKTAKNNPRVGDFLAGGNAEAT